jgi:hypothetical protein
MPCGTNTRGLSQYRAWPKTRAAAITRRRLRRSGRRSVFS